MNAPEHHDKPNQEAEEQKPTKAAVLAAKPRSEILMSMIKGE